jgi:hypothetical protein
VRRDCSAWLEDIADAMPSVVIEARDEAGNALLDVSVFSGDQLLATHLDGKALPLDPGAHDLRFEYKGQIQTLRVVALEGQAYRHVAVRFEQQPASHPAAASSAGPASSLRASALAVALPAPPPPSSLPTSANLASAPAPLPARSSLAVPTDLPPPDRARPMPLETQIFGGVGLASLTAFGVLATGAYLEEKDLRQSCARACDPRAIDSMHDRYLLGDVALAFGVSSLIAAGALWLFLPDKPASEREPLGLGLRGSNLTLDARF